MLALIVNLLLATDKIGCLRVDKLGLLNDLPDDEQHSSISVAEVAGDETLSAPRLELVESDEQEGSDTEEETEVGSPRVERSDVVQGRLVHALSVASAEPSNEDNDHHGVGGDETGGGEVDEPEENGNGGFASDKEGDAADDADGEDTVHWDTSLVTLHEESRGLAIASKTVEGSRGRVEVGVSARETGGKDEEVDQAGETVDAKVLNANDPGRSGSTRGAVLDSTEQTLVIRRADDTNSQYTKDVETNKSVEDEFGDSGNSSSRVGDLTRGQRDHIGTSNGETSVENNLPPATKFTKISLGVVGLHSLAALPVSESVCVALGVAAAHGDESDEEETEEEDNLERSHDEFSLTIVLDSNNVKQNANDHCHRDPGCRIDIRNPILHQCRYSTVFDTNKHKTGVEICPSHSKSKCRVDETGSKLKDGATDREVRAHLSNTQVARPDEEDTPDQVTENDRERTSLGENTTDTNEETGTDGATDSHELNMSRGETSYGPAIFSIDGVVIDQDTR